MALVLNHAGLVCKKHVEHAWEESVVPGFPSFITNARHVHAQVRYSPSCVLYAYTVNILNAIYMVFHNHLSDLSSWRME